MHEGGSGGETAKEVSRRVMAKPARILLEAITPIISQDSIEGRRIKRNNTKKLRNSSPGSD